MILISISDLSDLDVGRTKVIENLLLIVSATPLPGSFPFAEIDPSKTGHVAAFSSACTHMGCPFDTSNVQHTPAASGAPESFRIGPCTCHGTTFDLTKQGLVVLGPATQDLPSLELTHDPTHPDHLAGNWKCIPPESEIWPALGELQRVRLLELFNGGTLKELEALPIIGTARAKAISNGRPWSSIDAVSALEGIGEYGMATIQRYFRDCNGS